MRTMRRASLIMASTLLGTSAVAGVPVGAFADDASPKVRAESVAGKARKGVPMCRTEDQDTPCVWVANERGNHRGRSFYVDTRGNRRTIKSTPKPDTVLTSSGRIARVESKGAHEGCLWLTYAEQGAPEAGDPGDGEWFCAR